MSAASHTIIDHPEENLDNQTIFKVLVKCIRAAKQRRQVIMVTHNPNLALLCDAEQIISATCDKATNKFTYISGGIESPPIKARVVEILEGTEPPFKNRKQKYGLWQTTMSRHHPAPSVRRRESPLLVEPLASVPSTPTTLPATLLDCWTCERSWAERRCPSDGGGSGCGVVERDG
jgi:hypothetical protein